MTWVLTSDCQQEGPSLGCQRDLQHQGHQNRKLWCSLWGQVTNHSTFTLCFCPCCQPYTQPSSNFIINFINYHFYSVLYSCCCWISPFILLYNWWIHPTLSDTNSLLCFRTHGSTRALFVPSILLHKLVLLAEIHPCPGSTNRVYYACTNIYGPLNS